jgi:2-polyprenyl-3-methyl-5-hydroxy-6-metoxy-1,4-benzoquinol methylase
MDKSLLVNLLGFPATLIHGDTLVLDRWLWLRERLPATNNGEKLIDIGCGSGAFTIGTALRGYDSLGLSWDERNQSVAKIRAKICKANTAKFEVLDVRELDSSKLLYSQYDIAICLENIEHIIKDQKLLMDISCCLKPGGRLLLTTPNLLYRPMASEDKYPFSVIEDGGHVRRGYSKSMLEELCVNANLMIENISYCSGFTSQKITALQRKLALIHPLLSYTITFPLRLIPPLFDSFIAKFFKWPYYSICLEAYKPRYKKYPS